MNLAHWWYRVSIWVVLVVVLTTCSSNGTVTPLLATKKTNTSIHLALGNPSNAKSSTTNADNYLMLKPQYALSYNKSKGIPNWVSWQLNQSWLGNAPRQNNFRPDDSLPEGWYRVRPSDYTGSGFDKGHMAPSD